MLKEYPSTKSQTAIALSRGCASLAFLCLGLSGALASGEGPYRTVADVVREANTVAVVDTIPRGYDTLVTIREIIKGSLAVVHEHPSFILPLAANSRQNYVPRNTNGIVLALAKGWENGLPDPILEVYQDAAHIEAARAFVKIYQFPMERDQLIAEASRFNDPNRLYREGALSDFWRMREPGNFPILTGLFNRTDVEGERSLITLMKDIGDLRTVPFLISALDSSDRYVRLAAADALYWTFPGAPGVTAAFRHHLNIPDLHVTAGKYLAKRDPSLRIASYLEEGKFSRAERLGREGDAAGAKELWLQIVQDPAQGDFVRRYAGEALLGTLTVPEREELRHLLLPLLGRDATANDYLNALSAAKILRELHHPDCLPSLLRLLAWDPSVFHKSRQQATMGLRELGPEAQAQGASQAMKNIVHWAKSGDWQDNANDSLLELLWLGKPADFDSVEGTLPEAYHPYWTVLRPLVGVGDAKDETGFLIHVLETATKLPPDAQDWILFRLGDLRDRRAIGMLVSYLFVNVNWSMAYTASDALIHIGGSEVERHVRPLLTHPDKDLVRRQAMVILQRLRGKDFLPDLRRMMGDPSFGLQDMAAGALAEVGTPEDLRLLLPLSDFWKADRQKLYWVHSALASIRDRYDYDIHGPIRVGASG